MIRAHDREALRSQSFCKGPTLFYIPGLEVRVLWVLGFIGFRVEGFRV